MSFSRCCTVPEKFLITTAPFKLQRSLLDDQVEHNHPLTVAGAYQRPTAVDHILFSRDDGLFFFTDFMRQVISSMYLNGTGVYRARVRASGWG